VEEAGGGVDGRGLLSAFCAPLSHSRSERGCHAHGLRGMGITRDAARSKSSFPNSVGERTFAKPCFAGITEDAALRGSRRAVARKWIHRDFGPPPGLAPGALFGHWLRRRANPVSLSFYFCLAPSSSAVPPFPWLIAHRSDLPDFAT
jgi:hypothetical protein